MIYFQTDRGALHQGHVIEVLNEMPAECIHCGITSPPYWGLRDYNIEGQVWDANPDCEHVWGNTTIKSMTGGGKKSSTLEGSRIYQENTHFNSQGQFCQHCKAWKGSLGLEPTPELYIDHIVQVFREVKRVLHPSGTLWLNLGSSYWSDTLSRKEPVESMWGNRPASDLSNGRDNIPKGNTRGGLGKRPDGYKPKDLIMIPHLVAEALRQDGWYLRSAMPWVKRSAMPESATDRPASALEYMFLLSKSQHYFFDMDAIRVENKEPWRSGKLEHLPPKCLNSDKKMDLSSSAWRWGKREYNPAGRNYRNTDLFYESIEPPHGMIFCGDEPVGLDVNPQAYKDAHFATFSTKLVEPCLKSGTSEKGCCPECLAPWERIVEKSKEYHRKPGYKANSPMAQNKDDRTNFYPDMYNTISKTIGWKPTCKCYYLHDDTRRRAYIPIPCTVLDPFFGSGTVAVVAEKYRRNWIGIELSKEYCGLAKDRIQQATKQRRLF